MAEHQLPKLTVGVRFPSPAPTESPGQVDPEARDRVRIATYGETIRFNIVLVDDHTCVVQPYLPQAVASTRPLLVMRRSDVPGGLFPVFEQVYESIQERSKPL